MIDTFASVHTYCVCSRLSKCIYLLCVIMVPQAKGPLRKQGLGLYGAHCVSAEFQPLWQSWGYDKIDIASVSHEIYTLYSDELAGRFLS